MGTLFFDYKNTTVVWNDPMIKLKSRFSYGGRGMELSELQYFHGRLLAFDDRSGIIYEILDKKAFPWIILTAADGKTNDGFKSEWVSVKNNSLYVGSMGKEWTTTTGEFISYKPMFIKIVTVDGQIQYLNWTENYHKLNSALNITYPGYLIHESAIWSNIHNKWFFLPRRCSKEIYNEVKDEYRGCSFLLISDEYFHKIEIVKLNLNTPTRGFSSCKFLPNSRDDIIVTLRTEEVNGNTSTYLMILKISGEILLYDKFINDMKFEGLEIIV